MNGNPLYRIRILPVMMPAMLGSYRQLIACFPYHFAHFLGKTSVWITERHEGTIHNLATNQFVHRLSQFMLNLFLSQRGQDRMARGVRPETYEARTRHFLCLFPGQERTTGWHRMPTQGPSEFR